MKVGICTKCGVDDVPLANDSHWCETCVRLHEMGHELWKRSELVRQLEDQLIEAGREISRLKAQICNRDIGGEWPKRLHPPQTDLLPGQDP